MSVSEFQRHQVFQWFEEAMGPDKASIMMDLLPPVGWGDIATKTDLSALASSLRGEMASMKGELRAEIADSRAQTIRTVVLSMIAGNATMVGLVLAAVRL